MLQAKPKQFFTLEKEVAEKPAKVFFGLKDKLLQNVHPEEVSRLQAALTSDHSLSLYLEVLSHKQKLQPQGTQLELNQLAELLEKQYAYLKDFTTQRQLRILRESKDVGKVYYLLRQFTSDKPKTLALPAKDLADAFVELLYAFEMRAFTSTAATAKIQRWHLLSNQVLLFGTHFVFPKAKYSHKAIYSLNNIIEAVVQSAAIPHELHLLLMHNCVNSLFECSSSSKDPNYRLAMKDRIESAVEARGGWQRVELGIKKLTTYLADGSFYRAALAAGRRGC